MLAKALCFFVALGSRKMARVVDRQHAHETIVTQFKPRDRAVRVADPYGPQLGRVERAHYMQRENADRSRMTEDRDVPASVSHDDLVEFLPGTIQQLAVTLAAG